MNLKDLEKYFQPIIGEEDLTSTQLLSLSLFIFLALFVFYPLESRRRRNAHQRKLIDEEFTKQRKLIDEEFTKQRQLIGKEFTRLGITKAIFQENAYNRIPDEYIGRLSSEEIKHLIDLVIKHYPEKMGVVKNLNSLKSRTDTKNMKNNLTQEKKKQLLRGLEYRRKRRGI